MSYLAEKVKKLRAKVLGIGIIEARIEKLQHANEEAFARLENLQKTAMKYDAIGIMPLSDKEIAVKIFNDLIMYLDPRDIAITPHIALERIWEREITYAWLSVLDHDVRDEPVVMDIGANFGYYGMLAAQRHKKRGQVVLFEPNPSLQPYIHKTLSVNWLNENTVVENLGISDKEGVAELNVLEDYISSSSMHSVEHVRSYAGNQMQVNVDRVVKVPTTSIDDYCKDHKIDSVDLMIMDIEGYEQLAYAGMRNTVKNSQDLILFMEFTMGSYKYPEKFSEKLLADFKHVYMITPDGQLHVPRSKSYKQIMSDDETLTFLVLSKKALSGIA